MLPTLSVAPAGTELRQAGSYQVTKPASVDPGARLHLAKHARLSRVVTLQELVLPDAKDVAGVAAFVTLARDATPVRSPHLAQISEFIEHSPGHFCCVLEPLFGETLRTRINRGGVPVAEALEIVCQLTEALSALHAAHKVSGCLTASRVFLAEGEREAVNVKLVDYGMGAAQGVFLEPDQRAPEQRTGAATNELTDVYFLGSLMSEMIAAGERVPAGLQAVVAQSRMTNPAHRYSSVGVLCAAIIEALNPPYVEPAELPLPPRRARRWPIAVLLLTLAAAGLYFKWPGMAPQAMEAPSSSPIAVTAPPPVAPHPPPEVARVPVDPDAPSLRPNANLAISGALHQAAVMPEKPKVNKPRKR